MIIAIALLTGIVPPLLAIAFAVRRHRSGSARATRRLALSLVSFDVLAALVLIGLGLAWLFSPGIVEAAGLSQESVADPYRPIAAAIAVCVGSVSAAYAVSVTGSAAVGAIAEKPEVFGSAIIVVGLAEGVAIYGLIIAFIILR